MTRLRLTALALVLALVAVGCGGDDGGAGDEGTEEVDRDEAAEGQVLLEEDFDDDDGLWRPDDLDIDGEQDASIDDGAFTLDWQADALASLEEGQALVPNLGWPSVLDGVIDDLSDTRVEAEVSFEAPGTVGLACRIADVAPDADDFRAYYFQVASSGQVNVAESDEEGNLFGLELLPDLDEEEQAEVDELPLEDAAFDFEDGASYELSFTCEDADDGVTLTGTIDGEEVISVTDDEEPIDSGAAGLLSSQSRLATQVDGFEPFEVSFDSATIVNLGDEIDEDDLEESAEAAEEAPDDAEDPEGTDDGLTPDEGGTSLGDDLLGTPADPTTIGDYGTDPEFDLLATDCFVGDFESCDELYRQTPVDSLYEAYALYCGGRLETAVRGTCADLADFAAQPATPPESVDGFGTDPVFDELAYACAAGDLEGCDELYLTTPVGSGYEAYGASCGGRASGAVNGDCIPD